MKRDLRDVNDASLGSNREIEATCEKYKGCDDGDLKDADDGGGNFKHRVDVVVDGMKVRSYL
jgi:hypothetical protein